MIRAIAISIVVGIIVLASVGNIQKCIQLQAEALVEQKQQDKSEFRYEELGNLRVTAYRSVPNQTDDSPGITSIGFRTNELGIAVSRDFIRTGHLRYGDLLFIDGVGFRQVFDCMGPKARRQIDVWVPTYEAEQTFDRQFRHRKLRVVLVRRNSI